MSKVIVLSIIAFIISIGLCSGSNEGDWVQAHGGNVPPGAVVGGNDAKGNTLYVARAVFSTSTLPGMLLPSEGLTLVVVPNEPVHGVSNYEVLIGGSYKWESNKRDSTRAVIGGKSKQGETLYVARASSSGAVIPGYTTSSFEKCYFVLNGREHTAANFEVLVK